jgi:hypothetical protein
MSNIRKIADGANVLPLLWALQANDHLWNADTQRTADPASPHCEVDDIWARYSATPKEPGPHESVWYPAAALLPVREIVYPLMQFVRGERLGGVLLTRIRAGKQCKPHHDGGWHASYYDKFAVQVQSAPGQRFCFEGESLEPMPGDIYTFDNSHTHWVENPTPFDRITLIVCIKTDKG